MKTIDQKIAHVRRNTNEFISQIDKIGPNEDLGLCKFILVSCLIDAVAAYAYQREKNNTQYKNFIKSYLGQVNPLYKKDRIANILYHGIRCSLIHSFTISEHILLTEADNPDIHLSSNAYNHLIVDLATFYSDLKKAIKLFFKDLTSNKSNIQRHFIEGFIKNPPFDVFENVDLLDPNQPVTGSTKIETTLYKKVNFRRSSNSGLIKVDSK